MSVAVVYAEPEVGAGADAEAVCTPVDSCAVLMQSVLQGKRRWGRRWRWRLRWRRVRDWRL